jgi:YD repeat-containing protein
MIRLLAALLLTLPVAAATAQQQSFYDAAGRPAGHAVTDSAGTTTYYDAAGRVTGRTSASGALYDAAGRHVGTITNPPRPGGAFK